jgi:hypothetical protein
MTGTKQIGQAGQNILKEFLKLRSRAIPDQSGWHG